MRKIILIYGAIAGAIVAGMLWVTTPMLQQGVINFDNGMLVGYTTMVIALSTVFFAVKTYRDEHLDGVISFGKAFKIGILITLLAAMLYAISWEFYYNTQAPNFMDQYTAHYISKLEQSGATPAEIADAKADMAQSVELYQNPLIRFVMTLGEIFPVGLLISLIAAALLRKKDAVQTA